MTWFELQCDDCGAELDARHPERYWRSVAGWERVRAAGGTNHIAARVVGENYRCDICMRRALRGVHPAQGTLA